MNRKGMRLAALAAAAAVAALALPSATEQEAPPIEAPKIAAVTPQQDEPAVAAPPPAAPPVAGESVAPVPQLQPAPSVEKVVKMADGRFVIEGRTVRLRYADGRIEEKPIRIVATPVQRPLPRIARNKNSADAATSSQKP